MVVNMLPDKQAERLILPPDDDALDMEADPRIDALTRLAARMCDVPIAHVSLVDRNRVWLKSAVGMKQGLSLDWADTFCADTVQTPQTPTIVEDAREDARFATHKAVTGAPFVRFYAGIPLCDLTGRAVGTFCVVDTKPRRLSEAQRGVADRHFNWGAGLAGFATHGDKTEGQRGDLAASTGRNAQLHSGDRSEWPHHLYE